jgi:phenylalanyl-tRNA synthetase beta chain
MPLTQQRIADALRGLGLPVEEGDGVVKVTPPSFRFDIKIEEDLIEEVARMVGYNNLPTTPPKAPITAKIRAESQRSPHAVRRQLAALGYQETINFSFVDARWESELAGNTNPVALLNPIASQMSVMRSSLLGSLLRMVCVSLKLVVCFQKMPACQTVTPPLKALTNLCTLQACLLEIWPPCNGMSKTKRQISTT